MKFRAGDTVRVIARCGHFDKVGTIQAVHEGQDHPFNVTGLEPWDLWFGPNELILAEAPTPAEASR